MCVCVGGGEGERGTFKPAYIYMFSSELYAQAVVIRPFFLVFWTSLETNVCTFSLSVPRSFRSSLFLSVPGAWAVGSEEWKMKRRPLRPAAFNASIPALTTGSRMT